MIIISFSSSTIYLIAVFQILNDNFTLKDLEQPHDYMTYLMELLDTTVLDNLVDTLHLPKDSLIHFEIELLRQRLCSKFRQFQWFKFYDEEIDGVFGTASDSDEIISDEDDSDLEYWWSAIKHKTSHANVAAYLA